MILLELTSIDSHIIIRGFKFFGFNFGIWLEHPTRPLRKD